MATFFLITILISINVSIIEAREVYELKEDLPIAEQIGRLVPCSAGEKRCFQHGRIYNAKDGKCYVVGSLANCPFGRMFLDKRKVLENKTFIGKCSNNQPCTSTQVKTDDGRCAYRGYYCYDRNSTTFKFSLFGDRICINRNATVPYVEVRQPEEEGFCRVPDFRVPDINGPTFKAHDSPCSQDELDCFLDQRVLWPGDGLCYELLYTEPCEEGQWLVVDKERYGNESGPIIPICHPRPCPKGEVLFFLDGKCHSEKEVLDVWCSGGVINTNIFGESGCDRTEFERYKLPWNRYNGTCVVNYLTSAPAIKVSPKYCPQSNKAYCPRVVEPPKPDLPNLK